MTMGLDTFRLQRLVQAALALALAVASVTAVVFYQLYFLTPTRSAQLLMKSDAAITAQTRMHAIGHATLDGWMRKKAAQPPLMAKDVPDVFTVRASPARD
jgi:hypothetical protein